MLIDSHCHLDMVASNTDLDDAMSRAGGAGVAGMVTIATTLARYEHVRPIAERYPNVWCGVGVHPHDAGEAGLTDPERLIALAENDPLVVGIGESGLDYHYDASPREAQQTSFRQHIRAAQRTGLPLIVHARDADDDVAHILRDEYERGGPYSCVMHCFSSGRGLAEAAMELGFYLSFSGIVTFKKSEELRAIARDAPRDKLLVETDAPFLAPVPKRGRPNEPSYVRHTADHLAEHLGYEIAEFEALTTENFFRLFSAARLDRAA